jgi:hypothetical protein
MTTTPPITPRPTIRELLQAVLPGIFFVPVAGPPVILLFGPWLLLVLLLIPPAACLITLVLVTVVAAAALAVLGALVASPYLLARHLRARHAARHDQSPLAQPSAAPVVHGPAPTPARSGWLPAPAAGALPSHSTFTSQPDSGHISVTQAKGTT